MEMRLELSRPARDDIDGEWTMDDDRWRVKLDGSGRHRRCVGWIRVRRERMSVYFRSHVRS